eukprot:TRINITY_DN1806_c0_g1_i8.p1 TRINITY_DN1806_c0_g1~~TRINITY_DN1806_c0_g1_i8.p1  ORF type:complete len:760 (-),score=131.86 TRINITY_DN1806_c0_g1_i8:839-3118(-)
MKKQQKTSRKDSTPDFGYAFADNRNGKGRNMQFEMEEEGVAVPAKCYSPMASEDGRYLNRKQMSLNAPSQFFDSHDVPSRIFPIPGMSLKSILKLRETLISELNSLRATKEQMETLESRAFSDIPHPATSLESGFPGIGTGDSSPNGNPGQALLSLRKDTNTGRQLDFLNNGRSPVFNDSSKDKRKPKQNQLYSNPDYIGSNEKVLPLEKSKVNVPASGVKRGGNGKVESIKKQKVEPSLFQQCASLLKQLMSHKFGYVFNEPVDPVKLLIPDYFTIIKHPMDLGTIRRKLDEGSYTSILEFAADVRLTFDNAKTYNPPLNPVHNMANALSNIFERRWKTIEAKLDVEEAYQSKTDVRISRKDLDVHQRASKKLKPRQFSAKKVDSEELPFEKQPVGFNHPRIVQKQQERQNLRRLEDSNRVKEKGNGRRTHALSSAPGIKSSRQSHEQGRRRPMNDAEKSKILTDLNHIQGNVPTEIIHFLKKHMPPCQDEEDIVVDVEVLSDDLLWELRRLLDKFSAQSEQSPLDEEINNSVEHIETQQAEPAVNGMCASVDKQGDVEEVDEDYVDIEGVSTPTRGHGNNIRSNPFPSPKSQVASSSSSGSSSSSSDSDSESSSPSASEGNNGVNDNAIQLGNSEPEITVAVSALDEENVQSKGGTSGGDVQEGESAPQDRQVSPDRQLRAALLKSRFADTILRAREKTLPQTNKGDPEKIRKERELLEKLQREGKFLYFLFLCVALRSYCSNKYSHNWSMLRKSKD